MLCGIHQTEMKYKGDGISKAGKPYKGFWSCGVKDEQGNWCNFKPAPATTGAAQFSRELDQSSHLSDAYKKEKLITRTALAKSMIESGRKYEMDTVKELERWLAWVEGKAQTVTAPELPIVNLEDEIFI